MKGDGIKKRLRERGRDTDEGKGQRGSRREWKRDR